MTSYDDVISSLLQVTHENVVFALKKFTGGMGDEDEDQPDSNKTW